MKILLINPPGGGHYDGPMMGIPSLMGQLRQQGRHEARQTDLDLQLYYYCSKPATVEKILRWIRGAPQAENGSKPGIKGSMARLLGPTALKALAGFCLRDQGFFSSFRSQTPVGESFTENGLLRYRKSLNRVLWLMAVYFYPYLSYPRFFSPFQRKLFNRLFLGVGYQFSRLYNHGKKALTAFFEEELIPDLKREGYDVIGVSVSYKRQLEPARILAKTITRHGIEAKLVMGGSFITNVFDSSWFEDEILDLVDFVSTYEGEENFVKLIDCLERGVEPNDVPNLVYRSEGKRIDTGKQTIKDLDALAPPDYSDLPLDLYLDRPVRLPLLTSRGCYWGRCSFCSHHWTLGSGRLRVRSSEKLLQDMVGYKETLGIRSIHFTDEAVHPDTMKSLSSLLIEKKADLFWMGAVRFEECMDTAFLERLKQSGCYALMFGLESLSEHVQGIINKGIDLDKAHRILRDCKELGIKAHLFIIVGVPGEKEEDFRKNRDFLLYNTDLYETHQLAEFQLMVGSPMYRHPERFGISNIRIIPSNEGSAYSMVTYETAEGLSREEISDHMDFLMNNKILFKKDLWEGFGYSLFRVEHAAPIPHPTGGKER